MLGSLRSQTSTWSTSAWLNNWVLRLAPGGLAPLAANRLADCQRHTDCDGIGLAVHEQPIGGGGHGGQASWGAAAPGRTDGGERRPTMLAWSDEPREVVACVSWSRWAAMPAAGARRPRGRCYSAAVR